MSYYSATPGSVNLGADDQSPRTVLATEEDIPTHMPWVVYRAPKGPTKRTIFTSDKFRLAATDAAIDKSGKFYHHQTPFIEGLFNQGNIVMGLRLVSLDAGPKANVTVYMDYLYTDVPNYLRTSTGDLVADSSTGAYKVDPTTPTIKGYKIKYISEYDTYAKDVSGKITFDPDSVPLGLKKSKTGTMTDGTNQSIMVPIYEARASEKGSGYNLNGFGLTTMYNSDADTTIISKTKALPYGLYLVNKVTENSSPINVRTLSGETSVIISLKEKAIHPATNGKIDFESVFKNLWFNETDKTKRIAYKEYDGLYFYRSNFETALKLFVNEEVKYLSNTPAAWNDGINAASSSWFDFTTTDATAIINDIYLMNPFVCKSSTAVQYFTISKDTESSTLTGTQAEVQFSGSTPIYLSGSDDGTLTDQAFEDAFAVELKRYLDSDDTGVMDTAINVDSIMYDSGFSLPIKMAMINYITVRKDTAVALATYLASMGEKYQSLTDAAAIGTALETRLMLAPESTYFGTSVARCIICLGEGNIKNSDYTNLVPLTYELAVKNAAMMGASNGLWKIDELFDTAPKAKLDYIINYKPEDIPESYKTTLWNNGLVYAQPYDRSSYHVAAWQTVYSDDTSVLNSWWGSFALTVLAKTSDKVWRMNTGSTKLTDAEFIDKVKADYNKELKDVFGSLFTVVPVVYIDDNDTARGYSWHAICKLYGNVIKTKQVYNTGVYRASDLTSTSN